MKAANVATNPNMTIADSRAAGYCVRGCRTRCAALGLDFRVFMRDGFPVEDMALLGDAQIDRTLTFTKARLAKETPDGQ